MSAVMYKKKVKYENVILTFTMQIKVNFSHLHLYFLLNIYSLSLPNH